MPTPRYAMAEALPPRLGRLLVAHPDIDLELQELPSDAVLQALRRGVADVGIVADYVDTAGLATQPWIEDKLVALLPATRRRPRPAALRFAQLLDRPFVGLSAERGLSRFLPQQAARSGRVPQHRVRMSSFAAVARILETGVGVAVVPLSAASRWRDSEVLIAPLEEAWAKRRLLVCSTAQAETLPGARALVKARLVA